MSTRKIIIEEIPAGLRVNADNTPIPTPLGRPLVLPNRAMAEAIAQEWHGQGKAIRRDKMPFTSIACVAVDLVREKRQEVFNDILSYTDTDLTCYRAGDAPELYALQNDAFDPLLLWLKATYGISLSITDGIMPMQQNSAIRSRYATILEQYNEWQLAVLATVLKPLASLVLALALIEKRISAEEAFRYSHLEEEYETRKWGKDDEKEERLNRLRREITAAAEFLNLID